MVGIDLRTTMDMDATIKGVSLSETRLIEILKEIIDINVDDNIRFEILGIRNIMEEEDLFKRNVCYNFLIKNGIISRENNDIKSNKKDVVDYEEIDI